MLLSLKHCASCTSFAYNLSLQAHTQETALYGRIVRALRVHLCSGVALWRPFGGVGDSLTTKTHISTRRHPPGNGGYMMVLSRFDSRFDLLVLVTRPKYQGKILHDHSHHHVARRIDDNPQRRSAMAVLRPQLNARFNRVRDEQQIAQNIIRG